MRLCVINYNTPKLTECCVRSFLINSPCIDSVTVLDNSDRGRLGSLSCGSHATVNILDNTRGQLIDFNEILASIHTKYGTRRERYGSAKHAISVQWLIDRCDEPFILADSDTLNKRDISDVAQTDAPVTGEIEQWGGLWRDRLCPYLCYLNVPKIKAAGVRYYNSEHMVHLRREYPKYDTGAWFLQDLNQHGLRIEPVCVSERIEHLNGGSWRSVDENKFLYDHANLWN